MNEYLDNRLNDSRTKKQQFEQKVKSLGLDEAAEELRSNLRAYGLSNTTEPAVTNDLDYAFNWPVNGEKFFIQFKLTMSKDAIIINARANNGFAPDLEKLAEAAGYHLSSKSAANVYAPLAEYTKKPYDASERIEGEVYRFSSYYRGIPRSDVKAIVKLVQDFQIRLNLAKITLLPSDNSISEASSLVRDAIDVFKQRPEEKHSKS